LRYCAPDALARRSRAGLVAAHISDPIRLARMVIKAG
jgi:hypothetical protein